MYKITASDHTEYQTSLKQVYWQEKNQIPIMVTHDEIPDGFLSGDGSKIYAYKNSRLPDTYERPDVAYMSTDEYIKMKDAETARMEEDINNTMSAVVDMQMEQLMNIIE